MKSLSAYVGENINEGLFGSDGIPEPIKSKNVIVTSISKDIDGKHYDDVADLFRRLKNKDKQKEFKKRLEYIMLHYMEENDNWHIGPQITVTDKEIRIQVYSYLFRNEKTDIKSLEWTSKELARYFGDCFTDGLRKCFSTEHNWHVWPDIRNVDKDWEKKAGKYTHSLVKYALKKKIKVSQNTLKVYG